MLKNFFETFLSRTQLHIYTDGSSKDLVGAWAFVVVKKNHVIFQKSGKVAQASSNEMEFQAAIEALKYLRPRSRAILHTDSKILLEALTKKYRPKAFQQQTESLDHEIAKHDLSYMWVKAHNGNPFNELCDSMCRETRSL